jgi:hypothetical protein
VAVISDTDPTIALVFEHLHVNRATWTVRIAAGELEVAEPPTLTLGPITAVLKMLLFPTLHPHRTRDSFRCFVEETLGHEAVAPPSRNLLKALSTAESIVFLVFMRIRGIDPLDEIVATAAILFIIRYLRPFSLSRRRARRRGRAAEELTIDSTNR